MDSIYPSARSVRHAFMVLERLPDEVLFDLVERLIDRLDAVGQDCNLEAEDDACDTGECGGLTVRGDGRAGDADDAEPEQDDASDPHPLVSGTLRP